MRVRGNSLIEYALPLSIFFVSGVAVTVVMDLPQRLGDYFAGTVKAEAGAGGQMQINGFGNLELPPGTVVTQNGVLNGVDGLGTVSFNLSNGSTIQLNNFPADLQKTVETAGVNGATSIMLASMSQLIAQMEEAGVADPQQLASLKKLANAGHEIARIEKILEDAANASSGDREAYLNQTYTYNGQTYNTNDFATLISLRNDYAISDPFNPDNVHEKATAMQAFHDAYDEAKQSGALSLPEADAIVTHLTQNIIVTAAETETLIDYILFHDDKQLSPSDLNEQVASGITHVSSSTICQTGSHQSTGVSCL